MGLFLLSFLKLVDALQMGTLVDLPQIHPLEIAKNAGSSFRMSATRLKRISESGAAEDSTETLNQIALEQVLDLINENDDRWSPVVTSGRCRVWRLNDKSGGRHACILAKGIIEAPADQVYDLFAESVRAHEFNEFCQECNDLEFIQPNVKVSWSATKPFGVFKPRDFVTLCHFTDIGDAKVVVNRAVEHSEKPPSSKYQRAEVLLAANIIKPLPPTPEGKERTHLTLLTHINPKGAIDSRIGAKISNMLIQRSPVAFFDSIEKCAAKASVSSHTSNASRRRLSHAA